MFGNLKWLWKIETDWRQLHFVQCEIWWIGIVGTIGDFRNVKKYDVTYFPFDERKCELNFEFWNSKIYFYSNRANVILDDFKENKSWQVTDTSLEIVDSGNNIKSNWKGTIRIRIRFIWQYQLSLSILTIFHVALPTRSGEKIGYILMIAFTIFLSLRHQSLC